MLNISAYFFDTRGRRLPVGWAPALPSFCLHLTTTTQHSCAACTASITPSYLFDTSPQHVCRDAGRCRGGRRCILAQPAPTTGKTPIPNLALLGTFTSSSWCLLTPGRNVVPTASRRAAPRLPPVPTFLPHAQPPPPATCSLHCTPQPHFPRWLALCARTPALGGGRAPVPYVANRGWARATPRCAEHADLLPATGAHEIRAGRVAEGCILEDT